LDRTARDGHMASMDKGWGAILGRVSEIVGG
jgi:hypothetical protein